LAQAPMWRKTATVERVFHFLIDWNWSSTVHQEMVLIGVVSEPLLGGPGIDACCQINQPMTRTNRPAAVPTCRLSRITGTEFVID